MPHKVPILPLIPQRRASCRVPRLRKYYGSDACGGPTAASRICCEVDQFGEVVRAQSLFGELAPVSRTVAVCSHAVAAASVRSSCRCQVMLLPATVGDMAESSVTSQKR